MAKVKTFERYLLQYLTEKLTGEKVSIYNGENLVTVIKMLPAKSGSAPGDLVKDQFMVAVQKDSKQAADEIDFIIDEIMSELGLQQDVLPPQLVTGAVRATGSNIEWIYSRVWIIPHYVHTLEEGWGE